MDSTARFSLGNLVLRLLQSITVLVELLYESVDGRLHRVPFQLDDDVLSSGGAVTNVNSTGFLLRFQVRIDLVELSGDALFDVLVRGRAFP